MNQIKDSQNIEDVLALTPTQEGMLYHYLKDPKSDLYFEQLCLGLSGHIDSTLFEKAWNFVIETNEMLRTAFRWEKLENPVQIILKHHQLKPVYYNLAEGNHNETQQCLQEIKIKDRQKKFHLHQAEIPFRVTLCKIKADQYVMIISNFHILYDGWSNGILLKEFFNAYFDLSNGKELLKPVKTKFHQFVKWMQTQGADISCQEKYWKNYFEGFDTPTELSIKKTKAKERENNTPDTLNTTIEKETSTRLKEFIRQHQVTMAALLYSTWGILLQRYNNTTDVVFGSTVSGRSASIKGIEDMVGLFINTVPLRVQISASAGEKTIELIQRINKALQTREAYESTTLVKIREYIRSNLPQGKELFDSIVVIENYPLHLQLKQGPDNLSLSIESYRIFEMTEFDLMIRIIPSEEIHINFIYNGDQFERQVIERLSQHFTRILNDMREHPGKPLYEIDMLSPAEKERILFDFNDTTVEYPVDKTIHGLFVRQAQRTPDHIAVVGTHQLHKKGTRGLAPLYVPVFAPLHITYKELNRKSNHLTQRLKEKGAVTDSIVAIMVERSVEMIIGIFGILKAGGAYMPIDPDYPQDRIDYILNDSSAKILVTVPGLSEKIEKCSIVNCQLLIINCQQEIACFAQSNSPVERGVSSTSFKKSGGGGVCLNLQPEANPANLAYIIYTSGSTGYPKGVVVSHGAVVNTLSALQRMYPFTAADVYLLKTSYLFDVSAAELFGWYWQGGRLALLEHGGEKDPQKIIEAVHTLGITQINFVPSLFAALVEPLNQPENRGKLRGLKYIFLAGEAILPGLVKRFQETGLRVPLENLYGPTEAAVYASHYPLLQWSGQGEIPIGKPLQNVKLYILARNNQLQPVGVPGELVISGPGLARGYLNNPELTAERFGRAVISHSSLVTGSSKSSTNDQCPMTNDRFYKTGDLSRWLPDGNIRFLGRMDQQTKIRGYRIELEEIENRLLKHPGIKQAVAAVREEENSDRYLCAYVVAKRKAQGAKCANIDVGELREYLSATLPEYMVPWSFVRLERLPLTSSGKVNRHALPAPGISAGEKYIAPGDNLEKLLVQLWSEVLGIRADEISTDANFFRLGGHSLKATALIAKIHKKLEVKIPLADFFKISSVKKMARYIKTMTINIDKYASIEIVEEKEYYPLSPPQKRLYSLQQLEAVNTVYNMPYIIPIPAAADIDKEKPEAALKKLVHRHESLRTSFEIVDEEPVQKIHKEAALTIGCHETTAAGVEEVITGLIRPFDLSRAPLLRATLLKIQSSRLILFIDIHHIIIDGTSQFILENEFWWLYAGKELQPLKLQYKDFAHWQHRPGQKELLKDQEAYWIHLFSDELPVLQLPIDYPRPLIQRFEGNILRFVLDEKETQILKDITKTTGITLYMSILSVWTVLLSKLSGQEDIIVGTPVAARRHADLERIIGMFVNTLAIRNYPTSEKPFNEFLLEVKQQTLRAYENQEYPFEELLEKVTVRRDTSRNPIFDVMLNLLNQEDYQGNLHNIDDINEQHSNDYNYIRNTSKFDISLTAVEKQERILFDIEYSTCLFKADTIKRVITYFKRILSSLSADPGQKISTIEILTIEEKQEILKLSQGEEKIYDSYKTLHRYFEEQAAKTPGNITLVGPLPAKNRTHMTYLTHISYRELDKKSNRMACLLKEKGVCPDSIVGLMLERGIEMIVGILGILKSRGAYLPIDPDYPQDRIDYMLADSGAKILLTKQGIAGLPPSTLSSSHLHLSPSYAPTSLAYIMYTSGTTGKPKGVMIQHRSLVNLCFWHNRYYQVRESDHATQYAKISFDASVWEIFPYLIKGASLHIISPTIQLDIEKLNQYYEKHDITISFLPTQFCEQFMELENHSLRILLTGGDRLRTFIKRNYQLHNNYGPTENTVVATTFPVNRHYINIPIGPPVYNQRVYILEKNSFLPQPIGIPGELCIGGDGLARGYLNNPGLTAEKFVGAVNRHSSIVISSSEEPSKDNNDQCPMTNDSSSQYPITPIHYYPIYLTGDLGRWLIDGNIEFLGRWDQQIKIRGYRIELEEIENQLWKHPGIKEAVVTVREGEKNDKYLCAYIVAKPEVKDAKRSDIDVGELQEYLAATLPGYMVPAFLVPLEKLPLTPVGKVDRRALPVPGIKPGEVYVAPRDYLEKTLVELWAGVLAIEKSQIGIDANFFELGGHSLKTTILIARIHKKLGVKLPATDIFKISTTRKMAQYIKKRPHTLEEKYTPLEKAEEKEYYPMSPAQKRLYILQQLEGINTSYNMPYIMPIPGAADIDKEKLASIFKKLIARHESLRTSFEIVAEEPVQKVHQEVVFAIDYFETSEADLRDMVTRMIRPFELSCAPLLRAALIKIASSRFIFFIDIHHIIIDGTSQFILENEFWALYRGEEQQPLRLQYKDFSQWQHRQGQLELIKDQEVYWLNLFSDELPVLQLPIDNPRPLIQRFEGSVINFVLHEKETQTLRGITKVSGTTLYMSILALWTILLSKLSGQEDIIVGTPIAARRHTDLERIIGMFVNTLAIRNFPAGEKKFNEFLSEVKQRTMEAFENQEYPFEELVEKAEVPRDTGRNPIFDVMVNLLNQEDYRGNIPGINEHHANEYENHYDYIRTTSKFDLNLTALEKEEKISFNLEYSSILFKADTIKRIIRYFKKILSEISTDPGLKISEIEIITRGEKQEVLRLSRGPAEIYDTHETIHRWFEDQAAKTPDNIALIGPGLQYPANGVPLPAPYALRHAITYRQLNERSNQLARLLREKGVKRDTVVGLMVKRSCEMIIGLLAILKAGGAYLPIDVQLPPERKKNMIEDSQVKLLLKNVDTQIDRVPDYIQEVDIEVIDPGDQKIYRGDSTNLEYINRESDLIYVIYTSGSTGKPKGVMLEHINLVNLLKFQYKYTNIDCTKILQFATISFDASFHEIFSALLTGGTIHLIDRDSRADIRELFKLIAKNQIRTVFLPISFLKLIFVEDEYIKQVPNCITHIQTAGEQVVINNNFRNYLKRKGVYLHNHYGPSETHVVTALTLDPGGEIPEFPSIGKPILNTSIYIVDRGKHLLPMGIAGELYIGGRQVGRGYLDRPELTAEKFIEQVTGAGDRCRWEENNQKFLRGGVRKAQSAGRKANNTIDAVHRAQYAMRLPPGRRGQKIYQTGDLARWRSDANIQFLGRIDHQVKIRGFRVELGEIESKLLHHPGIKESVVIANEDNKGEKYICAYIVAERKAHGAKPADIDVGELREYLSARLPKYMIPSYFETLEQIPLTPSGKPDRKVLPKPGPTPKEGYIAPGNEIEKKLAKIWSEILGMEKDLIGIDDNFFQLGGHSLKATILISKIHKEMQIKIPLEVLFKHQTIRDLSVYIQQAHQSKYADIEPMEKREYYPLSSAQDRLYFLQQMDLKSTGYNMAYFFPLGKNVEKTKLESALKKLTARHESLRTSFVMAADKPVQKVHDQVKFRIEYYDLAEERRQTTEGKSDTHLSSEFIRPFDLSQAPLIRSALIKQPDNHHTWMIDVHHIVSDGTSSTILPEDFMALYNGEELAPLRLQYKEFTRWQNRLFSGREIKAQEDYWLELYADIAEIPRLQLPADYKRPEVFTFSGNTYDFMLTKEESAAFKALGASNGATLYMNILALLNILFYKYTGQTDIIIGSGIAGRPHADLQGIIGMFVNTLAMRNYPRSDKTYESFLKEVAAHSVKAFQNQDLQFEVLVDKLGPERDPARNPLFDVSMVVQNFRNPGTPVSARDNPGQVDLLSLTDRYSPHEQYRNPIAKFDMTFFVDERDEQVYITIEYYTGIFKEETIQRLAAHFKTVIKTFIKTPAIKLKDLDIFSQKEKRRVLYEFNDTARPFPKDKTIHELFAEQWKKTPDRIALVYEDEYLSYDRLDKEANRLAHYLYFEKQLQIEERVGILMERAVHQVVALLGVLKSGGAYLPIDGSLPETRVRHIIEDAGLGLVISQKQFIRLLNRLQWECKTLHTILCMDSTDIYSEEETGPSQLMDEKLWDVVAESATDDITGGGWFTSYTGEPFSREEMDEYGDNIFKKLLPHLHPRMRVLEIGCGTGLSMYRLAPRVGFYYATDLSRVVIEKNKKRVQEEGHENITLSVLPAHEIDKIHQPPFDLVIINSVIQSFPGHNYLLQVIAKAIDMLGQSGYLFIGDILDQDLKRDLIREMMEFKTSAGGTGKTKTDWSADLFVSRSFFEDLCFQFPSITGVEFSDKIHTIENELTKFRYDTLLTIEKARKKGTTSIWPQKYQHDMQALEKLPTNPLKTRVNLTCEPPVTLAYVIYTSGSTGLPKGVIVEHKSVMRLVKNTNYIDYMDLKKEDRFLLTGAFSFDITTFEIWGLLLNGISLYMAAKNVILEPGKLQETVVKNRISIMHFIPQLFDQQVENYPGVFESLRLMLIGGDWVNPAPIAFLRKNYPHLETLHMYGPTENTTFSTFFPIREVKEGTIPIGKPISNTSVYILDKHGNLQPIGVNGELCTGGDGVARGYLNNPELTAEKFCLRRPGGRFLKKLPPWTPRKNFLLYPLPHSPHSPHPTYSPIYKTGDFARWLSDGNIEFLGRIDHQVKIRGFRVELGEIENQLVTHSGIKEALVTAREESNSEGDQSLCAYITGPGQQEALDSAQLRQYLSQVLPDYMIPSYFVWLERFPLTASGKIDRKALPVPVTRSGSPYAAPANPVEKELVKIWSQVLALPHDVVGIDDNFFQLGGHSLKATILVSKIHKVFNVKVPLAEIFKIPSIRGLAQYMAKTGKSIYEEIQPVEKKEYYPQSSAQKRLYILWHMNPGGIAYNMPAVISLRGKLERKRLEKTFKKLIMRHESFRTSFKLIERVPVQQVQASVEFAIRYSELASEAVENRIKSFIRPFDISTAPLLRIDLIKLGNNNHLLMLDMHHIISDGKSMGIFVKEFTTLYKGEELPSLPIQYKDFSRWQNRGFTGAKIKQQEQYWLDEFKGEVPVLNLPTDYPRPGTRSFEGELVTHLLDKTISGPLKKLAAEENVTMSMILFTIYNILLSKLSEQDDIVVGVTVAGRRHAQLAEVMGMFVNSLAMRNFPQKHKTFIHFLKEVKKRTLAAFENQDYPFEKLVEKKAVKRSPGRNPMFDVEFVMQVYKSLEAIPHTSIPGLKLTPYRHKQTMSNYDLFLYAEEKETGPEQGIMLNLQYWPKLFKKQGAANFLNYYTRTTRQIINNLEIKIGDIEPLEENERNKIRSIIERNEETIQIDFDIP